MAKSTSNRIIATPSSYAKEHYLYIQEVGTLQSIEPHISRRQDLNSYLFFIVLPYFCRRLCLAGLYEAIFS